MAYGDERADIHGKLESTMRDTEAMERLVDQIYLDQTLEMLAMICDEKAQHIRENWQDDDLADAWQRAGDRIGECALHEDIQDVSL